MELHSYAKRKSSNKWTIEQKRKLVEARIAYDSIFSKKPLNCLITWKKVVALAKLEDFNVSFVRRQWANMVVKYKQYKRSRLASTATNAVDDELLRKISQEWEFFYPIHAFMSRKITNLHSYALTEGQKQKQSANNVLTHQQQQEQAENNASLASQLEKMLAHNNGSSPEIEPAQNIATFSSDTNEDYAAAAEIVASETIKADSPPPPVEAATLHKTTTDAAAADAADEDDDADMLNQALNTDHDFYSKKSPKHKDCFSDNSNDEAEQKNKKKKKKTKKQQSKKNLDVAATATKNESNSKQTEVKIEVATNFEETKRTNANDVEAERKVQKKKNINNMEDVKPGSSRSSEKKHVNKPKLNERDKYYRHKRRFNRRLERRFDKLLNVFGQIVKAEYPSIDVQPLLGAAGGSTTLNTGLKFPDLDEEILNGQHLGGALSSSGASSTDDVDMGSSNDERDNNAEEDKRAESATGKMRDC